MLENGIQLDSPWPPTRRELPDARCLGKHVAPTSYREPRVLERLRRRCLWRRQRPPYLRSPPPVVRIGTKRQLFIDSFLIARGTSNNASRFARRWHTPRLVSDAPILPTGESPHLHVNVDPSLGGSLRVGVLAADGKVLVRSEKCDEVRANSTDVAVTWGGSRTLGAVLPLKLPATVRLEFVARGRVALYSFWVGES